MKVRTHTCGELRKENIGDSVSLNGWISKSRDLGGLTFIDLRDRYGKTQIVFNEDINREAFDRVKNLGLEESSNILIIGCEGDADENLYNKLLSTGNKKLLK